jgi:hypothetical protein
MIFEFIPYKRYSYIIVCSNCNVFQAMIFPPNLFWYAFYCICQECSLSLQGAASLMNPQSLIRHMQSNYIQCIASGGQPPNYKFFLYA